MQDFCLLLMILLSLLPDDSVTPCLIYSGVLMLVEFTPRAGTSQHSSHHLDSFDSLVFQWATPIPQPNFRNACLLFCKMKCQTLQIYLSMIYQSRDPSHDI